MTSVEPRTMNEVELLVQELYQPGPPQRISQIQETLHRLQRSNEGWQLANKLMQSHDEKVKFFGALTFTVKLNLDSTSLSEDDARELLKQLLGWIIVSLRQSHGPLVLRKLCSTLVVYFLHFSASWAPCVKHLILSLYADEPVSLESLKDAPETSVLIRALTPDKVSVVLWFSTALAEEVGKTDGNNIKHHKFHERLKQNVGDVVDIIARGLADDLGDGSTLGNLRQDSMKCFQSWVLYSHRAYIDTGIALTQLKSLTARAATCLLQDDMYETTVELFSDVLTNYSKFLDEDDMKLLFSILNSAWSKERYDKLTNGDFSFESLQYGQLMIAFGDATVEDLAKKDDADSQQFLKALGGLLAAEGFAVEEDQIFVPALEFWSTFVEVLIDSLYSEEDLSSLIHKPLSELDRSSELSDTPSAVAKTAWFPTARAHVLQAIEQCWRKIQFPPAEIYDSWDSADKAGFVDARKEVVDLLQASYTLTGLSLFSMFANMALRSLQKGAWDKLEASIFCLGALADCIPDDGQSDDILKTIFNSPLFSVVADPASKTSLRTRQAILSLIGEYVEFFKKHTEYLPDALTFLFKALSIPSLADTASRSVQSLCSSCRQTLTSELDAFIEQYMDLISMQSIDGIVKERIIGSISAIAQAAPSEDAKRLSLQKLLKCIESDFQTHLQALSSNNGEEAEAAAVESLRCLASVAKGLQAPQDMPTDLTNTEEAITPKDFWINGPGAEIQQNIQAMIGNLIESFPTSGELIESACTVFRAGFTEKVPGPFVFHPGIFADFVLKVSPQTSRLEVLISAACSFASAHNSDKSPRTNAALQQLCSWLLTLLRNLGEPMNDPEIAQVSIDFIYRLLPAHVNIILEQQSSEAEHAFMFILKALSGRDPLPKFAAADFWATFLTMTDLPEELEVPVRRVLEQLGPALAAALVYNISGNAARSELDKLCEPLKKLMGQVRAKAWLEGALFSDNFTSDKVSETEKRVFLQKLLNLRGAKHTNQVVKNLWLACRGTNFAYTS